MRYPLLIGLLALAGAIVFLAGYAVSGRRLIASVVITGLAGAAAGAFVASAASALASGVDPHVAVLRGGGFGLLWGLGIGGLLAGGLALVRRLRR